MPATLAPKTGDVHALLDWFSEFPTANGPHDEEARETVMAETYRFERFGVCGDTVIFQTPGGRVIAQPREVQGCKLVEFQYVARGGRRKLACWFNASSVADLGDRMRQSPEKRADFDALFFNERA